MEKKKNILLVEDRYEERRALCDALKTWGSKVTAVSDGFRALEEFRAETYDLVITDLRIPKMDGIGLLKEIRGQGQDTPVILISGYGTVESAVNAMKHGALDFIVKPFPTKLLEAVVKRAFGNGNSPATRKDVPFSTPSIITKNPQILRLLELAKTVADSKAPVLIQGESGTGKELFARYIHAQGGGGNRPFVALNCAALPDGLLESELFGHEKGAFTGAVSRKLGKFELAQEGTILLDEISEMNIHLQAKLLRVLQESEVDRVGGQSPVAIDVRVVATTNREIDSAVKAEKFRADLYYRLNVIPIRIPPLRERREDIPLLAEHFVGKYNEIDGRHVQGLTDAAVQSLRGMAWPGNVRELENVIERAVLLCQGELIDKEDLFLEERSPTAEEPVGPVVGSLKDMEKQMIFRALDETDGNRTHAAHILGISVRTLRNKLNEYRQRMDRL